MTGEYQEGENRDPRSRFPLSMHGQVERAQQVATIEKSQDEGR